MNPRAAVGIWMVAVVTAAAACSTETAPPSDALVVAPEPVTTAPEPATTAPTPVPATTAPEAAAAPTPAPTQPATAAPEPTTQPATTKKTARVRRAPVIVYQASWCHPCHALSAHLTRRGVAHQDKDIEKTPGAQEEMDGKLTRAGRAGAQLPVMDFRGRIVVGYDPAAVDRLCDADGATPAPTGG